MKSVIKFFMLSIWSFSISTFSMEPQLQMGDLEKKCRSLVAYASAYHMKKYGSVGAAKMSTLDLGGNGIEDLESYINQAEMVLRMNKAISIPTDSELRLFPIFSVALGTNKLKLIPNSFSFLSSSATHVDVTNNQFEELDSLIELFPNAVEIQASHNPITVVSGSRLSKLPLLKRIILPKATMITDAEKLALNTVFFNKEAAVYDVRTK